MIVDMSILVERTLDYKTQLVLTEEAITQTVQSFGITYQKVHDSILKDEWFFNSLIRVGAGVSVVGASEVVKYGLKEEIKILLTSYLKRNMTAQVTEEFIKTYFPGIGQVIGATTSMVSTYYTLNKILSNLEGNLCKIFDYCKKNRRN